MHFWFCGGLIGKMDVNGIIEALNYARLFSGKKVVVKIGGELLDAGFSGSIAQDLAIMRRLKIDVVAVHGGGKKLSEMMEKFGKKPQFAEGKRVTDAETLELAEMAFLGNSKSKLLKALLDAGEKPVGLSGRDAAFVKAKKEPALGLAGKVESVDPAILDLLLKNGFLPVLSSLAYSEEDGLLNVNADDLAVEVAKAIGAEKLVFLTNVDGVLDSKGVLVSELSKQKTKELLSASAISGGMIPKVESAVSALKGGISRVHIISGAKPHSLLAELFSDKGIGTMIVK